MSRQPARAIATWPEPLDSPTTTVDAACLLGSLRMAGRHFPPSTRLLIQAVAADGAILHEQVVRTDVDGAFWLIVDGRGAVVARAYDARSDAWTCATIRR
jgi:hypothetical protein